MRKFNFKTFASKNAASGLAIAAMIGVPITCFFVAKETPEFNKKMEENKEADVKDKILLGITSYKKSIAAALLTEGAIFGSNHVNHKNIATLSALCASQAVNYKQFEEKANELFGKDKVTKAKQAVVEEKLHQPEYLEEAIHTGHGNVLCYEPYIDKFFYSSQAFIEQTAVNMGRDAQRYKPDYIPFNEWLNELKLYFRGGKFAEDYAFQVFQFEDSIGVRCIPGKTADGIPYLMLAYDNEPVYIA